MTDQSSLEREFHEELLALLQRAVSVAKVSSTELLDAVRRKGGLQVAKQQMDVQVEGTGRRSYPRYFKALFIRKRVDLSIEFLILDPRWQTLFRVLEDVQNSVETRGSPELVVYAAWAWAGGGVDSLPSWSSNFGKCR